MEERQRQREQGELALFVTFAGMAALGGWLHSSLLALFGALGALSAGALYVWQREALVRLVYRLDDARARADFGERLELGVELVNDKILPLPWVRITDLVPRDLAVEGEIRATALEIDPITLEPVYPPDGPVRPFVQLFAMLPFQRATRRLVISCDQRGRHLFGPSTVVSGDPLGVRQRSMTVGEEHELIVYPKVFALVAPPFVSRTPLGEDRVRRLALGDPTRVAGMRAYRPGDPLRHVDWRATARSGDLLVRDFEPTTTLRVTLFVDCNPRTPIARASVGPVRSDDPGEFAIALAASLVTWADRLGVPVGIYGPGTVDGEPLAVDPTSSPAAAAHLLERLALCEPDSKARLADVIAAEADRLQRGTTVLVIAADFDEATMLSIAECRRRAPVTAVYVTGVGGTPPTRTGVDSNYLVEYRPDWQDEDSVTFAR